MNQLTASGYMFVFIGLLILFLGILTGCTDSRCPQGTGYTWKCDAQGNCGCHSNPGGL